MKTKLLILFLICSQISFGQGLLMAASGTSLMKGLVAGWEFDETSGTTAKDGVSGWYPGTINSNVGFVSGKIGNAFDFHTNDSARVATSAVVPGTTFSFSAWIYMKTIVVTSSRIFDASNYLLLRQSTTQLRYNFVASTTIGVWTFASPSENSWHHIVVTHDFSSINNAPIIYIDGSSVSLTLTTSPVGDVQPFYGINIGNNRQNLIRSFQGYIDEPLLWNRVLTSSEVSTLYTLTNSGKNINNF